MWGLLRLLGFAQALRFAAARLLRPRSLVELRVSGIRHPVLVRAAGKDIHCFWQVFGNADCDVELPAAPRTIVDGGAHIGLASVYLANKYPGAVIVALEPDEANYELARRNLRHYPQVRLVRAGLWHRDALLTIDNPEAESWAFRVREVRDAAEDAIAGRSLESLLGELGLPQADLVKLDIEGAEAEIFGRGAPRWLDRVTGLIIELHGRKAEAAVNRATSRLGLTRSRRGEKVIFIRELTRPRLSPARAEA
ncbi:MAG TPA: FkbM family methyltransferase [Gammaproteobacteria bacterium]